MKGFEPIGVVRPGWIELTVTPSGATSRARVLRKPVTPARAVFERISSGMGWRTAIEVMATTRPPRGLHGGDDPLASWPPPTAD